MMKIYLIHRWGGSPSSEKWFGWLKKECDKLGIKLIIPKMPDTDYPEIEKWVNKINDIYCYDKSDIYFIGHSIGCQAIMRYLERFNENKNIKGLIFVAPWMKLDENTINKEGQDIINIARPWIETPINFSRIKSNINRILCIFSDNDPYVPLSNSKLFKENLGAEIVIKHNESHFNETKEINEIINYIKGK